jgi:hypothetical protein
MALFDLLGSMKLYFKHNVDALIDRWSRRAIEIAQELGPLEEPPTVDAILECGLIDENIGIVRLPLALGSGCPRPTEPQR